MDTKKINFEQLGEEIARDLEAIFKGVADESQARIIENAPVSTGALRASIRAGVNTQVVEYSSDTVDQTGNATKAANGDVIKGAKLGDTINITVGAPYGDEVEGGTSDVAPSGFVRVVGEGLDAVLNVAIQNLGKYR